MIPVKRRAIILLVMSTVFTGSSIVSQDGTQRIVWPAPPQEPRIEFLQQIASPADIGVERSWLGAIFDWIVGANESLTGMVKPMGVAVDRKKKLYVTDPGAGCVHIFDRENKEYEKLTTADDLPLRSPVGVAVADDGTIYVSDSERRQVIAYDDNGDEKFIVPSMFHRPTGVVIHRGKLYVTDTVLHKVLVFDLSGQFLYDFGQRGTAQGEFNYPVFLASSDRLLVVDAMNFRVQMLGDSGQAFGSFGRAGDAQGTFAHPKGVAVDREGHIYVADALFDAFQIFDNKGTLLLVVGTSGRGNGEFSIPEGICTDRDNRIYVVDSLNRRVQVFRYIGNSQ